MDYEKEKTRARPYRNIDMKLFMWMNMKSTWNEMIEWNKILFNFVYNKSFKKIKEGPNLFRFLSFRTLTYPKFQNASMASARQLKNLIQLEKLITFAILYRFW